MYCVQVECRENSQACSASEWEWEDGKSKTKRMPASPTVHVPSTLAAAFNSWGNTGSHGCKEIPQKQCEKVSLFKKVVQAALTLGTLVSCSAQGSTRNRECVGSTHINRVR